MRQPSLSMSNALTIFVLFFGIALLDAIALRLWWIALLWVAIGGVFVALAARGRARNE